MLRVFLVSMEKVPLLLPHEKKPLLIHMDSVTHVLVFCLINWIPGIHSHFKHCQSVFFCKNRSQGVRMDTKGQFNNPMMQCCFGNPHQLCHLLLSMPLAQWFTLDTLLNELSQILRHSPGIFFREYSLDELIMPMAGVHSAHFHSLCIIECAMLNLSVTAMREPLFRRSSIAVISNMEIASKH